MSASFSIMGGGMGERRGWEGGGKGMGRGGDGEGMGDIT